MERKDDTWMPTVCYMCYSSCGIKAHRRDEIVAEIRGDPANPHNLGKMCAKGKAGVMGLYDPYRVKRPLKRTNPEKGIAVDPGWKEISWEEALNEIVERLAKIREDNPRKLVLSGLDFHLAPKVYRAFASAFGTPNVWLGASGYFCGNGLHPVLYSTHGTFYAEPDFERCNYCICVGTQLGFMVNTNATTLAMRMAEARSRRMKVVVIDPVCTNAAAKADNWISIRPGTDAALILGVINHLLNALKVYDAEFIKRYTNGPYLVGPEGLYMRDEESGRPLIWDSEGNKLRPFDAAEVLSPALTGTYQVHGADCQPAFQLLKEHVKGYSPEMVSSVTGISAAEVVKLAGEIAEAAQIGSTIVIDGKELPLRPVAAVWNRGAVSHRHGMLTGIAIQLLNTVLGAIDVPGGLLGTNPVGPFWQPKETSDGLISPADIQMGMPAPHPVGEIKAPETLQLKELFPVAAYSRPMFEEAVLEGDSYQLTYQPEAMLLAQSNCLLSASHPSRMEKVLRKVPFIACFNTHLDETIALVDIVLPDAHYLERLVPFPNSPSEFLAPGEGSWYWAMAQPVVELDAEVRPWGEVFLEIAERLGIGSELNVMINTINGLKEPFCLDKGKQYSWAEIVDIWAKSWFGPERGLGWFKEHGVFISAKKKVEEAYPRLFLKPRIPIYYEHFIQAGQELKVLTEKMGLSWDTSDYQPLPDWKPCLEFEQGEDEYDLYAVNYKLPFHTFSNTAQNPWLSELAEQHPFAYKLLINPTPAQKKGLKEGDAVWVESSAGRVKGKVKLTQGVHPEVVAMAGTFGHWAEGMPVALGKGLHFNSLLPSALERIDPVSAAIDSCVRVRVYKA